jgi:AraC-like DNA-binding protein
MKSWYIAFTTLSRLPTLPRLFAMGQETRSSPQYAQQGRNRTQDHFCVFQYTLGGEGLFVDACGEHALPPGHGFLCEICDPEIAYRYPPQARTPWSFIYVEMEGEWIRNLVKDMNRFYGRVYEIPPEHAVIRQLQSFGVAGSRPREIDGSVGGRLIMDLMMALIGTREERIGETREHQLVRQALACIHADTRGQLNVAALADRLQVTREHLTRCFLAQVDRSPGRYMMAQRLNQAQRLLGAGGLTCKQVADRTGFKTPAHFARTFKAAFGVNPRQFLQRHSPDRP